MYEFSKAQGDASNLIYICLPGIDVIGQPYISIRRSMTPEYSDGYTRTAVALIVGINLKLVMNLLWLFPLT